MRLPFSAPRISALLLSTGLIAATVATCAAGTAQAAEPGASDGQLLVQRSMTQALTAEDADGSNAHTIGNASGDNARWSADGTRIAYEFGVDAYVEAADGTGSAKLLPSDYTYTAGYSAPTFVHDDGGVVFAATPQSNGVNLASKLYIAASDGMTPAKPMLATQPDGYSDIEPTAHGDSVYFVRSVDTNPQYQQVTFSPSGALMRTDLATGTTTEVMDGVESPDISPDGTKVVFVRQVAGVDQLFTANTDGTGVTQITTGASGHEYPAWSPTGTRISYSTDGTPTDKGMFVQGSSAIHVLTVSSGDDVVADAQARGFSSWQPVGATLPTHPAMPSSSVGNILASRGSDLVLNDAGSETVVATGTDPGSGAWFPAADRIVYAVDGTVYAQRRDGSGKTVVGSPANKPYTNYSQPAVCPDGQSLVSESGYGGQSWNGIQTTSLSGYNAGLWQNLGNYYYSASTMTYYPNCVADGSVYADFHGRNGEASGIVHVVPDASVPTYGATVTMVVPDGFEPAVSADGKSLAYVKQDAFGVTQLFVSGIDGSNPVQLTTGDRSVHQPAWSPDGTKIAVNDSWYGGVLELSAHDGTVLGGFAGATRPQWEPTESPAAPVPPAGSAGPITTNQGGKLVETPGSQLRTGVTDSSAWFPTGNRYVYSTGGSLYSAKPDGSGVIRLTQGNAATPDIHPSVSPDSAFLAFMRQGNLYTAASDGKQSGNEHLVTLTDSAHNQYYSNVDWPVFLNDDSLAFYSDGPSGSGIYHLKGGVITLMIPKAKQAVWSPTGDRVAYVAPDAHGIYQLYVAAADGSAPHQLTSSDHELSNPTWSGDGTMLAYYDAQFGYTVEVGAQNGKPLGQAPGAFPAWVPSSGTAKVIRVWGADRLGTAIAASQYDFPKAASANTVVLSRSDLYADALGGSSLAVRKGGPLLITPSAALDSSVATEISRVLKPGGVVYLLGGTGALSPRIEAQIRALGFTPVRLGGANRYQTAIQIANAVDPHPATILIATGMNFTDALAAGATGEPLVLTDGRSMPADTAHYLNALNPNTTDLVTIGGPGDAALIAGYQAGMMPSWPQTITRYPFVGAGAMDTAVMVAAGFTFSNQAVALATVAGWPDALSGGAMIGNLGGPLLLTTPSGLYAPDGQYLATQTGSLTAAIMLGGPGALPDPLVGQIAANIGVPGHVGTGSVTPSVKAAPTAGPGGVTLKTSGPGAVPAQDVTR